MVAALQIALEVILGMGATWSAPATMGQLRKAFDAYSAALLALLPLAIPGTSKQVWMLPLIYLQNPHTPVRLYLMLDRSFFQLMHHLIRKSGI